MPLIHGRGARTRRFGKRLALNPPIMRTSLQLIGIALVLAGCSAARQPRALTSIPTLPIAGDSLISTIDIPRASLAKLDTATPTGVRPMPLPLAGVRAHHMSTPRGMNLARYLGDQTALTLSAGSGPRRDSPEMQLTLGLRYEF